ncbi:MAG: Thivi_2564 family membrane protein [Legionellaceae bacterium]
MSGLFNLLAIIVIFGLVLWLVNAFIPMPGAIKTLLNVVVLIVLIIYVLQFFGLIKNVLPMMTLFK